MMPSKTLLSDDRLALFGLGLFETLLISDHQPLFADLHWQRMNKGAHILDLRLPNRHEWLQSILEFIKKTPENDPYAVRVTLSGGSPLANIPSQLLIHRRLVPYTSLQYSSGIRLHLLTFPRNEQSPLCSIKSTNYLENLLGKEEARKKGCEEGVWLNTKGYLSEGTMSNLFFLRKGTLFTPSLSSGCLPGTRRQIILKLARSLNIPSQEGSYALTDLLSSEEIFMTNALMGVMPVCQVNDFTLSVSPPGSKSSAMRCLETAYKDLVNNYSHSITL